VGSHRMRFEQILLKISAPLPLIKINRLAKFISKDSAFKELELLVNVLTAFQCK
jgi:hypothetical protein